MTSRNRRVFEQALPVLAVLTIIIAHLVFSEIGLPSTLAAMGLSALLALLAGLVGAWGASVTISRLLGDLPEKLSTMKTALEPLPKIQAQLSGLKAALGSLTPEICIADDDFVAEYEADCRAKHIWVITPDLHKDVETPGEQTCFRDVVHKNVTQRGITYTYLLQDTPTIHAKKSALLQPYTDEEKNHIRVIVLSKGKWDRLPYRNGDFAIYNPLMEPGVPVDVICELPVAGRNRWVKVDRKTVDEWIGIIQKMVPDLPS